MKKFIFLFSILLTALSSCSNDDSMIKTETENLTGTKDLIELNFIPTFENYFGRDIGSSTYRSASLAVEWNHDYDEEGRLLKSTMYEIYPSRLLKEISFSDYSSDNLEVKIEVNTYTYFSTFPYVHKWNSTLALNEDFSPSSISSEDEIAVSSFDELNSEKWVTKLGHSVNNEPLLWTTNFEYDQKGNVTRYSTTYHQYEMTEAAVDYTYTDWGDPLSYYFQNAESKFSEVEYFYRENNTLEKLEENFDLGDEDKGQNTYLYDENEAFLKQITNYNNGSKTIVDYDHEAGKITEINYTEDNNLSEIYIYLLLPEGERYFLSTHESYLNGIIKSIKYFKTQLYNTENDIVKQEFYDENGDLEYTEFYDENGNLTETVYA